MVAGSRSRMRGSAFSVRNYAEAIVPPLRDLAIRTLVEPGRFLIGTRAFCSPAFVTLSKRAVKNSPIVDAGMNDLIRPALYQSYHEIVPVQQPKTERERKISKIDISDRCVSRAIFLRSAVR